MPPSKRSRPADCNGHSKSTPECFIASVPLEILAEMLSYTVSPRDVLAVARTCKYFCAALVNNPSTTFIWRQARARCLPKPIPDFPSNFTEASFAAFLFDHKTCDVCGDRVRGMYRSFSLRIVVCSKVELMPPREHLLTRIQEDTSATEFLNWMPRLESDNGAFHTHTTLHSFRVFRGLLAMKTAFELGNVAFEAYLHSKQILADALPAKIEFYRKIRAWGMEYEHCRARVVAENWTVAQSFASSIHEDVNDVIRTATFRLLHDSKCRSLQRITDEDLSPIRDIVETEVAVGKAKSEQRIIDVAQQVRHNQIKTKRKKIQSSQPEDRPVLPSVNEFRRLPIIKVFETTHPTPSSNDGQSSKPSNPRTLDDPFVNAVLEENLDQWRQSARASLASVLGFPTWRNLSKRKLHPVDRLTARFRCRRCDDSPHAIGTTDGGMDFTEACGHTCAHLRKKKKLAKDRWSAERFVADQKAVDAISQALSLCNTEPDSIDSIKIARELGDRLQCQSCHLVMDVASVGRHCKRHVDGSFILLAFGATANPPLEHGLSQRLIKDSAAKAECDEKVFICRHCERLNANETRLFSFNGMRSHLKEKHLIAPIADEDFFRQKGAPVADAPA
ncbi:uncharacterized protein BXZ73DRAFT_41589 [Epithele typhae]|uniref:uncharacterized protein n=1 Tax=Epithele typhae TaxID=378194 RepID=UPI002007D2B1|nr:uncharacterized protein BXZ73DRAFT_41589 [Epithele typhae]KAH9941639.1 hypothetical protein BXZ73DRAFT_41589 [Epithele typhae]